MNYKKLIEQIYQHRFKWQSISEMLSEFTVIEISIYEDCQEEKNDRNNEQSKFLKRDNLKYKHIFIELKKEIIFGINDKNKINYIHIRKIINNLRNKYNDVIFQTDEELLIKELQEIIECGLNLSENKNELEYLIILNRELSKQGSY